MHVCISDDEEDVDFDIIHNANDTFTVKYVPPAAGRYTIKVLFASQVCVWTWVLSGHLCSYFLFAFFSNREGVLRTLPNSFPLCFLIICAVTGAGTSSHAHLQFPCSCFVRAQNLSH